MHASYAKTRKPFFLGLEREADQVSARSLDGYRMHARIVELNRRLPGRDDN